MYIEYIRIYIGTFYIFSGTGSISSGSAKSVTSTCRSESRLDESFSGSSASFPNSPTTTHRKLAPGESTQAIVSASSSETAGAVDQFLQQQQPVSINGTAFQPKTSRGPSRSRSEETFHNQTTSEKRLPNLQGEYFI